MKVIHFVPSEKAERQLNSMCGYVGPQDEVSRDWKACTCQECRDWLGEPSLTDEQIEGPQHHVIGLTK